MPQSNDKDAPLTTNVIQTQQKINTEAWVKSFEQNPNPDEFYTVQVSSAHELKERAAHLTSHCSDNQKQGALDRAQERLEKLTNQM